MKVLIPIDGSESSLHTIKSAASFLNTQTIDLYFLTVRVPAMTEVSWTMINDEAAAISILEPAVQEAKNAGFNVKQSQFVMSIEPASAICEYADEVQADLIVIGSHGYQGLAKFLMGSVSERVFKLAKQPVIVLRNDKTHTMEISHFESIGLQQIGNS